MPYFSRLTDIVTCNLTMMLANAADPGTALVEIIREMEEGVAGAERSSRTAAGNVARIETDIAEQTALADGWITTARQALSKGNEVAARNAIVRKQEVQDLVAGLEQQLQAAVSTRDHLTTTLHALEARLADARRRCATGDLLAEGSSVTGEGHTAATDRSNRVDAELEELRRQLQE